MSKYMHIDLSRQTVATEQVEGEDLVRGGRYRIAKTLLAGGIAKVDPLSPANPLMFSTGPFAGSGYTNANRLSVGCKSPLTGTIKESNAGGQAAQVLARLGYAALILEGKPQGEGGAARRPRLRRRGGQQPWRGRRPAPRSGPDGGGPARRS